MSNRLKSVVYSDIEALSTILALHIPDGYFECDVTYSTGGFYKDAPYPEPRLKYDIDPKKPGVKKADVRKLPLLPGMLESAVFDPPFIVAAGVKSIMGNRFSSPYKTMPELQTMYTAASGELHRVLAVGGILVVKCQDGISGGRLWCNTNFVYDLFVHGRSFEAIDKIIKVNNSKMHGHNHGEGNQQHTDRVETTFWVFKKVYGKEYR